MKLLAFDLSLRNAAAHTPVPIAARLRKVQVQVTFGLSQLPHTRT
jgi:hypothetical protein